MESFMWLIFTILNVHRTSLMKFSYELYLFRQLKRNFHETVGKVGSIVAGCRRRPLPGGR